MVQYQLSRTPFSRACTCLNRRREAVRAHAFWTLRAPVDTDILYSGNRDGSHVNIVVISQWVKGRLPFLV